MNEARVLPLELVPVPGHGAQISAPAPTEGCVQTGVPVHMHRARALSLNVALDSSHFAPCSLLLKLANCCNLL